MFKRLSVAAGFMLLAACSSSNDAPVALGTLERDRLELPAEASEPIVEIAAREGTRVQAGQLILKLDEATSVAKLEGLRAQADSARHRLEELVKGPRAEEILEAQARLEGAESALDNAAGEYERLRGLVKDKLISQSALDQQKAARDAAEAARKQARAQVAVLVKGTRVEELDRAREDLKGAQAQLKQMEISAGRLQVTAPRTGVVEALPYKLGERPPIGAPVVVMLADGETYARIYVPQALRTNVTAGTAAQVKIDGKAEVLAGRVRYISAEAAFTPYFALTQKDRGQLSYLAEVLLTEPQAAELPAGLPVEVTFTQ